MLKILSSCLGCGKKRLAEFSLQTEGTMAYIKVPSWLDLLQQAPKLACFKPLGASYERQQAFWKEQTLRFGFDIRQCGNTSSDHSFQSFFYAKFFEYTLKRLGNSLQGLKAWEKSFWKRNGRFVEKLEIHSISLQDLREVVQWFPNLKWLSLTKCNTLLQPNKKDEPFSPLLGLKDLHTLEIQNVHLISARCAELIPGWIQRLIIKRSRGFSPDFFEKLDLFKNLTELTLKECHGLELSYICKLPRTLRSLDLSGSGTHLTPEALVYLPQDLEELKFNGWNQYQDTEIALLPRGVQRLEIEGWQITGQCLAVLASFPLTSLNIARTDITSLDGLPKSLKKLNISQNKLTARDLDILNGLDEIEELSLCYIPAFDGNLGDLPITFPSSLKKLDLSYSGPLDKKSIHNLKSLSRLQHLSLAGCSIENSDLEWLGEKIEWLDLTLCADITDVGIMQLKQLQNLHTLIVDGCEQIRGFGLTSLSQTVKKLSFAGCHRLSGKSLVHMPALLEELSLEACDLITNGEIACLPSSLQVISLAMCPHITNEALEFLSRLPHLNTICLLGCPKITETGIGKLLRRKFEGTIIIKADFSAGVAIGREHDIELHPTVAMLKKLTNFKARFLYKLQTQALR